MAITLLCNYFLSYNSVCRISFQFSLITCVGSHGLLRQENPEFDAKRQQLFEYYHPLEFSPTIPIEEKTRLMEEWYMKSITVMLFFNLIYPLL